MKLVATISILFVLTVAYLVGLEAFSAVAPEWVLPDGQYHQVGAFVLMLVTVTAMGGVLHLVGYFHPILRKVDGVVDRLLDH